MAMYRMTAARKAALRKAQAASARKRKGRGRSKPGLRARAKKVNAARKRESSRKRNYARKNYSGAGGIYKMNSDRRNSRGAFERNWRGKKYGSKMRKANKAAQTYTNVAGINPLILGASYARGRRKGTIKKRKR